MHFEWSKVYEFQYAGLVQQNDASYFLLTYEGKNTMPGYEDTPWVFRVEVLEYQRAWSKDEIKDTFPCYVAGFIRDHDGTETTFPILKQDVRSILQDDFTIGKSYPFTIVSCPGDKNEKFETMDYYKVRDHLGFEHRLKTSAVYKIGDAVELTIDKIGERRLEFADPVRLEIQGLFKIGQEYSFLIESEECDEHSKKNFFTLRDKIKGFLHRFYFEDEHPDGPGDTITLKVKGITSKGWLLLIEPGKTISDKELQTLEQIEDRTLGREDEQLEYKSSFVFTATGEQNIDSQLGREIMQQLAAFMNAGGGMVCIGYRDDGTICGINKDIQYLNSSNNDDTYTYDPTLDGIELKIRNTIGRKLGGFANGLVRIDFRKSAKGLLVCHLIASPSAKPIYLNRSDLYKRSGNMCQRLRGDEITFFILDHLSQIMQNAKLSLAANEPAKLPDRMELTQEVAPQEKEVPIPFLPQPEPKKEKLWQYLTLYADRTVSRGKNADESPEALFNVALTTGCKAKGSRLLLCYDNGCVNVLNPGEVVSTKLTKEGHRYSNGSNSKARLLAVMTCTKEDFLVIRSRRNDTSTEMIKAVALENYAVHDPMSMQTQGNRLVDPKCAVVEQFEIVPGAQSSFIYPIIVKSKNGVPGFPAHNSNVQNVLAFLKKRKRDAEAASPVRQ